MSSLRRPPLWAPAVASVGAALSLLGPWVGSGAVDRSTIEMLSSASALDLLEGRAEVVALAAWYLIPVLAAAAALAAGWRRWSLTAAFSLPMGPVMALAWMAVVSSPFPSRWGSWLGVVLGVTASTTAVLILMTRRTAEGEE